MTTFTRKTISQIASKYNINESWNEVPSYHTNYLKTMISQFFCTTIASSEVWRYERLKNEILKWYRDNWTNGFVTSKESKNDY
jgi:hypothetical protein